MAYDLINQSSGELSSLKRAWPFADEEPTELVHNYQPSYDQLNYDELNNKDLDQSVAKESFAQLYTCFGSILGVNAQLIYADTHRLPSSWNGQSLSPVSFGVRREGNYFALYHDNRKIGRLNKKICDELLPLKAERVTLEAHVESNDWAAVLKEPRWQRDRVPFPLEINIYGQREAAERVGKLLSKSGLCLQPPHFAKGNAIYYNPQLFRVDGFSESLALEGLDNTEPALTQNESMPGGSSGTAEAAESRTDPGVQVDSILDSLSHHIELPQIRIDSRIKTQLLDHQKEAIDFITKRETGKLSSELSLWKYNDVDADEPFYQHVFTGAKRPQQEECKGGIIADEMGVGKSLVILSRIAGSINEAGEFASGAKDQESGHSQRRVTSKATLIFAPSSLLIDSWADEIRKHTYPGSLSFHRHLGQARYTEQHLLFERDIVFTTYATAATDFLRGNNLLERINWFRIVLDEAHDIRNQSTKQHQAAARLSAQHRWCLTGTPIQNSLEDLGSLLSFLKVPILEKPQTFRKFIITPASSMSRGRFQNLQKLLQTICIRRTRDLLNLPEPIPMIKRLQLTTEERAEYQNLVQQCRRRFDMAISGHVKGKLSSSTVLEALLALRLFCNNGRKQSKLDSAGLPLDRDEALSYLQQHERDVCAYCSGTIYSISALKGADGGTFISPSCSHLVCRNCLPAHGSRSGTCQFCESGDESISLKPIYEMGEQSRSEREIVPRPLRQYPSKLRACLSDIMNNLNHKSIVFSFWKTTLKLVSELFDMHGIRYCMIDGDLSLNERKKLLNEFRAENGANVLLMTLGTGAVGLNLAVATRIYLLEPQWNPSIESQAVGRALRIGQTKNVVIIRYTTVHTVEESNVLNRQKRKLQLAGGGFGKGKNANAERLQSLLEYFEMDPLATET